MHRREGCLCYSIVSCFSLVLVLVLWLEFSGIDFGQFFGLMAKIFNYDRTALHCTVFEEWLG